MGSVTTRGDRRLELSVVVPTWGRPDGCARAVESVRRVADRTGLDMEIIVVEQGDEPTYPIPDDFVGQWLFSSVNGAAYARNVGLEAATRSAVWFLDDDAVAFDGIADVVAEHARRGAALTCGRMVSPGGGVVRGGDRMRPIRATSAFRYFVEGTAVWDSERLRSIGGFDERLGPPFRYGAEEGAEALGRLARLGATAVYVPIDVLEHPALDQAPMNKAFRYGRGTSGAAWLTPSSWMLRYAGVSGVRRVGGILRAAARLDRQGVVHRVGWLGGYVAGVLTGWQLRRRPRTFADRPVVRLR